MPPKKDAKGGAKDKAGKGGAGGSEDKGDCHVELAISRFVSQCFGFLLFKARRRKVEML